MYVDFTSSLHKMSPLWGSTSSQYITATIRDVKLSDPSCSLLFFSISQRVLSGLNTLLALLCSAIFDCQLTRYLDRVLWLAEWPALSSFPVVNTGTTWIHVFVWSPSEHHSCHEQLTHWVLLTAWNWWVSNGVKARLFGTKHNLIIVSHWKEILWLRYQLLTLYMLNWFEDTYFSAHLFYNLSTSPKQQNSVI